MWKNISSLLLYGYFFVGGILAVIMEGSYIYGGFFAEGCNGFVDKMILTGITSIVGLLSAGLQMIFWLPTLILWVIRQDVSFWYWLAPGIETSCG